jgi:hypothetical protein
MAQFPQLPVKTVTARPGFVAKTQTLSTLGELRCQFGDVTGAVRERSHLAHLTATHPLGNGDRHRRLVHIQAHEYGIVHQARPPCLRLGTGQSGATLDTRACRGTGR